MNVLVLGSGLVGRPMAIDLANDKSFNVSVADISKKNLDRIPSNLPIKKIEKDIANPEQLKTLLKEFDLILNAVPGFMGYNTLKEIIKAKKNVVDIAFFPENPFDLDELAKQNNVTAVVDCGVAPGMSNLLCGYVDTILDELESILIYVGGLPLIREWPYEYKAGFSPIDVIQEYTRPARYIENGKLVIRPALSDPEFINFPEVGTLEAFNSDGLRTLAHTIKGDYMIEKTLRYKGHIEKMAVLRDTGFFNKEPLLINGAMISPLEFTSRLLFPKWKLQEGEEDMTIMQVITEGLKNGVRHRYTWDLFDRYDKETGVHSMARTTGYTATAVARLLAKGLYRTKGISAPEYLGKDSDIVNFLLETLKDRGVVYKETFELIQ